MANTLQRNKNLTRPHKRTGGKDRRVKTHQRRLIALGLAEEDVLKMNPRQVRTLLRHPAKIANKKKPKAASSAKP